MTTSPSTRRIVLGTLALIVSAGSSTSAFAAKPAPATKRDSAPPAVAFTQPSSGASLSGAVTLAGTASDNVAVAAVQTSVDGGTWSTASGTTSWTSSVDTSAYGNGTHTVYAKATDSSGNVTTTSMTVTFANGDTTAPSVGISTPSAGATVSGAVTVQGSSSDNVGVSSVAVQVDGGAWQAVTGTTSWSWTWNTAAVANGTHTVTARATDGAGNTKTSSESVTVSNATADTTPPAVTISSPASGSTVSGTVGVAGSSSDNTSVARVDVQVDGGAWQSASGTTSWSWSWNSGQVANGAHTVIARATDSSGNTSTTSATLTVSNSTAGAPDTQGSWVSPEGVHINVNSAGPWTIAQVYNLLKANAYELDKIGPTLTIDVQDTYASQTATGASSTNGVYTSASSTIYLKGVNSTFASHPDSQETHEYGHAWTLYHLYVSEQGAWSSFLNERWSSSDGSVTLATDSRTGSSYNWDPSEIIADDYRLLFGTSAAQVLSHLNPYIVDPRQQPGLKDWFLNHWATGR